MGACMCVCARACVRHATWIIENCIRTATATEATASWTEFGTSTQSDSLPSTDFTSPLYFLFCYTDSKLLKNPCIHNIPWASFRASLRETNAEMKKKQQMINIKELSCLTGLAKRQNKQTNKTLIWALSAPVFIQSPSTSQRPILPIRV